MKPYDLNGQIPTLADVYEIKSRNPELAAEAEVVADLFLRMMNIPDYKDRVFAVEIFKNAFILGANSEAIKK